MMSTMSAEANVKTREPGAVWAYTLPLSLFLALALVVVGAPAYTAFIALGGSVVSSIMGARHYGGAFATFAVIASVGFFVLAGLLTLMQVVAA